MAIKEKLKRLLEVAIENGWENKKNLLNQFESVVDNIYLYDKRRKIQKAVRNSLC